MQRTIPDNFSWCPHNDMHSLEILLSSHDELLYKADVPITVYNGIGWNNRFFIGSAYSVGCRSYFMTLHCLANQHFALESGTSGFMNTRSKGGRARVWNLHPYSVDHKFAHSGSE